MEILDLKKHKEFLQDYVKLRNFYSSALLTNPVTTEQTNSWINDFDVVVLISIEKKKLRGACILHTYRDGEVTIFTDIHRKGVGEALIKAIETIARKKQLQSVWAWIDTTNAISRSFFHKNGYTRIEEKSKIYHGKKHKGAIFSKSL